MTTEPKEPTEPTEPTKPEGDDIPSWGQRLQEQMQEVLDSLKNSGSSSNQTVPVPPAPNHTEPQPTITEPTPQPPTEPPQEQPQNPVKKFLSWLM